MTITQKLAQQLRHKPVVAGTGATFARDYEEQALRCDLMRRDAREWRAPPSVEAELSAPGHQLDPVVRGRMEARFGHDFGRVRVHDGPRAAESARALNASAYTFGHDIVFGEGQYRPFGGEGQRLLAHELAHVVQQGRFDSTPGLARSPVTVGDATHPTEREADDAASRVSAGLTPVVLGTREPHVARQGSRAEECPEPHSKATNFLSYIDLVRAVATKGVAARLEGGDVFVQFNEMSVEQLREYRARTTDYNAARFLDELLAIRAAEEDAVAKRVIDNYNALAPARQRPGGRCYSVARSRIDQATREVTGKELTAGLTPEQIGTFDRLWGMQIDPVGIWLLLPEQYRGLGSAGALVWAGKGALVVQAQIWAGALRPGAAIQTWRKAGDAERVRNGNKPTDYGHSFVFLKYIRAAGRPDGAIVGMRIADQGFQSARVLTEADYEYWVAANITIDAPPSFVLPTSE